MMCRATKTNHLEALSKANKLGSKLKRDTTKTDDQEVFRYTLNSNHYPQLRNTPTLNPDPKCVVPKCFIPKCFVPKPVCECPPYVNVSRMCMCPPYVNVSPVCECVPHM